MTPIEAGKFFEKAFLAFPGLASWLRENSPEPAGTCSLWASTLSKVSADEAEAVLDGWLDGSIKEPPVGYKRETFALNVKALVLNERSKIHQERAREEIWMKSNRGKYQPSAAFKLCEPLLREMYINLPAYREGEMTAQEYDRQVDLIAERAFK